MSGRANELSAENARLSNELEALTQKVRRLQHEARSLDPASARTRQDAVRIVQRLESRLAQATTSRLYALPAWTAFMVAAMDGNEHLLRLRLARGFHMWHEEVVGSSRRRRARERAHATRHGEARKGAESEQTTSEEVRRTDQQSDGREGGGGWSGDGDGGGDGGGGRHERLSADSPTWLGSAVAGRLAAVASAQPTTTTVEDAPHVAIPADSPRLTPTGSGEPGGGHGGGGHGGGGHGGVYPEESLADRAMRLEEENERKTILEYCCKVTVNEVLTNGVSWVMSRNRQFNFSANCAQKSFEYVSN